MSPAGGRAQDTYCRFLRKTLKKVEWNKMMAARKNSRAAKANAPAALKSDLAQ